VNCLLDANAVVALLRNKPAGVRERYREAQAAGDYLSGDLDLLDFDDEDARTAGQVRTANTSEFSRVTGLSWQDWTI
jgi:tRNA(fMet)-specific endonuclease VapC